MIEQRREWVFYAPTRKRRYFTRSAAIEAEVNAIIYKKYPREPWEEDTGAQGYDIAIHEPEKYQKMKRRLKRLVAN